ncbi:hypothetical protein [Streptomyces sp. XD-27]|uniref:hypothetical protein n=1 Tax=Streptomyces sp. XD-27 TaxID=3062779 RepID=UPI00350E34A8
MAQCRTGGAAAHGVPSGLARGLLKGLDWVAAAVLLTDGSYHEVDSSEFGYKIAGQQAARAALIGAGLLQSEEADTLRWATWPGRRRPWPGRRPSGCSRPSR